jgi:hypothetical protein
MSTATKEPKASLKSEHSDWLKKIGSLLGVNASAPQGAAAAASSGAAATKREVKGGGGYVFEQHADGKIFIIESPKHGKGHFEVTDPKAYKAILAEIGPFPQTPGPHTSSVATTAPTAKASHSEGVLDQIKDAAVSTADRVGEALQGVMDGIGSALDGAADYLFSDDAGKPKVAAPGSPPAQKTPAPSPQPQAPDTYRSQRDNPELADVTCNVTSLAMQLISLAGGDETKLRETAVKLLKDRKVTASTNTQLEELLRQLAIKVAKGPTVTLANGSTYDAWEIAWVLDGVSELFTDYVQKTETVMNVASKEGFQDKVVPAVEKGAVVMLSTKLTSSGHIVKLNEVLADGILLDDPYGCLVEKQGGYLRNGANVTQKEISRINDNAAVLDARLKSNSDMRKTFTDLAAKKGSIPGNAGKNNFYSWDEVKTYSIGKWVNITYKK